MSMLKIKTSLSVIDVSILVNFLKEKLKNCYISKIYQIDEIFLFKLANPEGQRYYLILSPRYGIWLTRYEFTIPETPPEFCKQLRRKLTRGKLIEISQYDFDRIIFLKIKTSEDVYTLVLELVREGNLILLNSSNKILLALRQKVMKDRAIVIGETYKPPPSMGLNPLIASNSEIIDYLKKLKGPIIARLIRALSLPKEVVKEVLYLNKINEKAKIEDLEESTLRKIVEELKAYVQKLINCELHSPVIIFEDDKAIGVYPYLFSFLKNMKFEYKTFDSFNNAVDEYFKQLISEELREKSTKKINEEIGKLKKVLDDQRRLMEEYYSKAQLYREIANYLFANYHLLLKVYNHIDEIKSSMFSNTLKTLINELNNFGIKIMGYDFRSNSIVIDVRGVKLKFDIKKSIGDNISQIYNLAKEFEKKAERAKNAIKEIENKIKELEKGLALEEEKRVIKGVIDEKKWYERFRWFISSEGFLVIAGRNAQQNEKIVRKYLEDRDLFFHADIRGASVVVVKTEGKNVGEVTIREAAEFAAAFSKAWTLGFGAVDVFWVKGNQVSKSPPSGEYLPKGSFMIYGKRNYLKKVPLRIAIGLKIEEDKAKLIVGPVSAVKNATSIFVELIPGNMDRRQVAERIIRILTKKLEKYFGKVILKVDLNEVMNLLPEGKCSLISTD